ncbi:MAG: PspA/IM30 family protein [Candidatus Bipolaricaulota bacterium]
MNLWLRLKTLVKAKLRKWRNNDEPRVVLQKNLAKMEKYLQEIKKSSLELGREKGTLQRRLERLNYAIEEYEKEARQALALGEEQQAEIALKEKYNVLRRKKRIEENVQTLNERITSLERSKDALKNRIEIFRTKEAELDALRSASEAELRISEITAGMSEETFSDINNAVKESERKLQEIQAKVKATRQLLDQEEGTKFDEEMGALDEVELSSKSDPEEELERLKRNIEGQN